MEPVQISSNAQRPCRRPEYPDEPHGMARPWPRYFFAARRLPLFLKRVRREQPMDVFFLFIVDLTSGSGVNLNGGGTVPAPAAAYSTEQIPH